jgi:hypothetical protein
MSDVDDASEWIREHLEEMLYPAVSVEEVTGYCELNFYTHDKISDRERYTLVSATSPRRYTSNKEE